MVTMPAWKFDVAPLFVADADADAAAALPDAATLLAEAERELERPLALETAEEAPVDIIDVGVVIIVMDAPVEVAAETVETVLPDAVAAVEPVDAPLMDWPTQLLSGPEAMVMGDEYCTAPVLSRTWIVMEVPAPILTCGQVYDVPR